MRPSTYQCHLVGKAFNVCVKYIPMPLCMQTLAALQRHLWDLSVDRDVLFGYILQSLVTLVPRGTRGAQPR